MKSHFKYSNQFNTCGPNQTCEYFFFLLRYIKLLTSMLCEIQEYFSQRETNHTLLRVEFSLFMCVPAVAQAFVARDHLLRPSCITTSGVSRRIVYQRDETYITVSNTMNTFRCQASYTSLNLFFPVTRSWKRKIYDASGIKMSRRHENIICLQVGQTRITMIDHSLALNLQKVHVALK